MRSSYSSAVNFTPHLVESLYVEAMILADEARHYFEHGSATHGGEPDASARVDISCESLRLSTRVMHCIAWLLNQKAFFAGELSYTQLRGHGRMLGENPQLDAGVMLRMPAEAQRLIQASSDLFTRIKRLENGLQDSMSRQSGQSAPSMVHGMRQDLLSALQR